MPDNSIRLALLNFCDKIMGGVRIDYFNDDSCQMNSSSWLVHWSCNIFFSGERAAFSAYGAKSKHNKRTTAVTVKRGGSSDIQSIFTWKICDFGLVKTIFFTHVFPREVWIFKHQRPIVMLISYSTVKMKVFIVDDRQAQLTRKNMVLLLLKGTPINKTNFKDIKKGELL